VRTDSQALVVAPGGDSEIRFEHSHLSVKVGRGSGAHPLRGDRVSFPIRAGTVVHRHCLYDEVFHVLARAVGSNGVAVGIDPSESMIEYARRKAASMRNCEFQVGAAEALPFTGEHFDVVVSSLVLHHLPEDLRKRALDEMWRIVRPGGSLLVAEARTFALDTAAGPAKFLGRLGAASAVVALALEGAFRQSTGSPTSRPTSHGRTPKRRRALSARKQSAGSSGGCGATRPLCLASRCCCLQPRSCD
jgi:SAM-dependent methyltransferase